MIREIILYTFLGAAAVLIIMNPGGFTQDVGAVFKGLTNQTLALSGAGYASSKPVVQ